MPKQNDILKMPQSLNLRLPEFRHVALTLVGCGGTGSHIASGLITLAQALSEKGISTDILFIDPDIVEPKNVGRQLFSQADVGRPKAHVLAERLNAAFAATVGCAVRKVDTLDKFGAEDDRVADDARNKLCVVVGAVDTASARKVIAANVRAATGRVWWLDCGNENHSGQVALGNSFGKIDARQQTTLTIPSGTGVGIYQTRKSIEVPSGEVWFLSQFQMDTPAQNGGIVLANVRLSQWPDTATTPDSDGLPYWAADRGGALGGSYVGECYGCAPAFVTLGDGIGVPLRLPAGAKATICAQVTVAALGADRVVTLTPYGWKGKLLAPVS